MLFDIKKNLEKIALSLSNETKANENMLHAYFDYLETGDEEALDSANTQFRENSQKWRGIVGVGFVGLVIDKIWSMFA